MVPVERKEVLVEVGEPAGQGRDGALRARIRIAPLEVLPECPDRLDVRILDLADLTAEEHELVALAERQRAELVAHAELGDHPAGQVGRLLDVVAGTGRGVAEDQAFRGVADESVASLESGPGTNGFHPEPDAASVATTLCGRR